MFRPLSAVVLLLSVAGAGCGVITPSDFSLQVDTPNQTVQRGTATDIPVRISRTGREEPVQVTLRNLPSGVDFEPVQIPVGQESATLHVRVTDEAPPGDYLVDVVATALSRTDTDGIRIQVTDIPQSAQPVIAFEPSLSVLEKGRNHDVTFSVDRSGGFTSGFRVELRSEESPWISFDPVLVPYEATRFTLTLKVDEHHPVGSTRLILLLSYGSRASIVWLPVDISTPQEAPPQLTAVDPPEIALGALTRLTLTGTGLSSTTLVTGKNAANTTQSIPARIVSATSGEVQAELRFPSRWPRSAPSLELVLEVQTPTGTATTARALTLSPLYVEPLTGSDTTGSGTRSRPYATIPRALNSCGCDTGVPSNCDGCTITLAPGIHRPGSIRVKSVTLAGSGDVYGDNPSVIEGAGEERFELLGAALRQVKLTGYKRGLEADKYGGNLEMPSSPSTIADVWLTGGDYGISRCREVRILTEKAPVRISHNRIAGVACESPGSIDLKGSATWPMEVTHNGDGSAEAGGVVFSGAGSVTTRYLVASDNHGPGVRATNVSANDLVASNNRGPGVKADNATIRDSVFQRNEGPGVWVSFTADLGTVESPGGNTLQDNAINLRVDSPSTLKVSSAVGNCWNPPAGEDYADTSADGSCGRILEPFSLGGVTYIDAQGLTQGAFTWSAPPRFNYFLSPGSSGTSSIQF